MDLLGSFFETNWALLLLASAFLIMIQATVHLNKKATVLMLVVVLLVAVLTVVEFAEVTLGNSETYSIWRTVLSGLKYIIPSFILAVISCVILSEVKWILFIPAAINAALCLISIGTGWVFRIKPDNHFERGPIGYLPFIVSALYIFHITWQIYRTSTKYPEDIVPLAFMLTSSLLSVFLPIIWGFGYEPWFCTTIMIDVFVYYVYLMQQLTKKDALTGLLNRQSYYFDSERYKDEITAVVSLDMNGLKEKNDTEGHDAGDKALVSLANCFLQAVRAGQRVYRVGGDEFMILCMKTDKAKAEKLVERIRANVADTEYSCSVGFCVRERGEIFDDLVKISDECMYAAKAEYYREKKNND